MTAQLAAILEQAQHLTQEERELLVDALRASNQNKPAPPTGDRLLGMFAHEPEIVDEVMEEVHRARSTWHLRDRT